MKVESTPSFVEKNVPYKDLFVEFFYVFLVCPRFCYLTGEFPISLFGGHPGCEVPHLSQLFRGAVPSVVNLWLLHFFLGGEGGWSSV